VVRTWCIAQGFNVANLCWWGWVREVDKCIVDARGVGLLNVLVPDEEGVLSACVSQIREGKKTMVACPILVLSITSRDIVLAEVVVLLGEAGIKVSREYCGSFVVVKESFCFSMDQVTDLLIPGRVVNADDECVEALGCRGETHGKKVPL
jgi:hypothetical protein